MGGGKSKNKVCEFNLTQTKRLNIYKMFNAVSKEEVPTVTPDALQNLWKDIFSHRILELMMDYLFKTSQNIKIEDLEVMYYKMIEGTPDERAQVLVDILGVENSIPADSFQTVTVRELRDWLIRCVFVCDIYESVIKFVFNMEMEELKPVLPRANKFSSLLTIPMVLAFSHLIYGYMKKDWRLLYSSLTDAQSWNMLSAKVTKQGPTVILIEDATGPLFGGFASHSWKICPTFYGDECCFLFQLRPQMELYSPTGYNQNFQYMNHGAATLPNGLGMGGQLNYFTFFLSADFGPVTVSKSSTTFRNYAPLASANEFTFSKLEILAVGNPDVEEENVRVTRSIMDQDPGATAILEIAGKTIYSKNLKQSFDEE